MPKRKLTFPFIDNYKSPEKRKEIYDKVVDGMALRVTPTGHKSFVYRYRFGDKVRRYTIGSFPEFSLAAARDKARELHRKIKDGIDPIEERKAKKYETDHETVSDLADEYKERHLPSLRESTSDEYRRLLKKEILPVLGDIPVDKLSRRHIIKLLDKIAVERGKGVLSNRVRAVLSSMYSYGVDRAIVEANPVLAVPKRKKSENKRERVYSKDEIRALWKAFEQQAEPVQSIFKMLLLCGQRSGETRRMRWEHLDNDNVWVIPASETKAKRTHHVPLSDSAVKLIENLKILTGTTDYVFASQSNRVENQPVKWLQKAVKRIQNASKVKDFRVHDLRRTAASYMAKLGVDRTVLGKVLNHKGLAGDDQVTAIYDRHNYMDEKRQALNRWARHLQKILSEEEDQGAKITQIGSAKN
ncbi:tyrosine-type recombinase/integrase [Fodinibius saliphilus]|uniref:tyrosine-type recombinase/integrase n=1 Tax=Fodinibius saliphilus TaxID=1920650 RepID=UPI0014864E81|nr:site-specific integrase [Fodinibius saliphilus]